MKLYLIGGPCAGQKVDASGYEFHVPLPTRLESLAGYVPMSEEMVKSARYRLQHFTYLWEGCVKVDMQAYVYEDMDLVVARRAALAMFLAGALTC